MEYTLTEACNKEYYTPPKTPKIKSDVGLGIDDVKVERMNFFLEVTKILVDRMRVETQELSRRMTSKKWYNTNSQFPSIVDLSKSKNNF